MLQIWNSTHLYIVVFFMPFSGYSICQNKINRLNNTILNRTLLPAKTQTNCSHLTITTLFTRSDINKNSTTKTKQRSWQPYSYVCYFTHKSGSTQVRKVFDLVCRENNIAFPCFTHILLIRDLYKRFLGPSVLLYINMVLG